MILSLPCISGSQRIDGLVNGAGWDQIQPFLENPPEMWDRIIAINLMGAVRLTRGVLPPMVAAGTGKIVNISSDAGRVGSMGETVYAAAKGGLIAFTKSLARELARYRINVNCVCPGPTDTPLFQRQPERMKEALTRAIPFRRIAQPIEIAAGGAVLFERPVGLHHRSGAERQRRLDDGGLKPQPPPFRQGRNGRMPSYKS